MYKTIFCTDDPISKVVTHHLILFYGWMDGCLTTSPVSNGHILLAISRSSVVLFYAKIPIYIII